jgi:hypothetical protein
VLGHVPAAQRCKCSAAEKDTGGLGGLLKSLFKR